MTEHSPRSDSELIERIRAIDERAPAELHERIGLMVAGRSRSARGPLGLRLGSAAVALAALVIVLVASLGGGSGGSLSLREASALTLAPATAAAPSSERGSDSQLTANVEGVAFPYWDERFGWQASGSRVDQLHGHTIQTVFYANRLGQRVGYAIVGGPEPRIAGGSVSWRHGTAFRVMLLDGSQVVTWTRRGHLCVVSGRGVGAATLLALASWREHGSPT